MKKIYFAYNQLEKFYLSLFSPVFALLFKHFFYLFLRFWQLRAVFFVVKQQKMEGFLLIALRVG